MLQEDLECEIDGAAACEQIDRRVEIDVVARGEDDGALGVVAGPLEGIVPPVLDSFDLGHVQKFELSRRHSFHPSAVGELLLPIRPLGRIGLPLSGGICRSLTARTPWLNSAVVLPDETVQACPDDRGRGSSPSEGARNERGSWTALTLRR